MYACALYVCTLSNQQISDLCSSGRMSVVDSAVCSEGPSPREKYVLRHLVLVLVGHLHSPPPPPPPPPSPPKLPATTATAVPQQKLKQISKIKVRIQMLASFTGRPFPPPVFDTAGDSVCGNDLEQGYADASAVYHLCHVNYCYPYDCVCKLL